MKQTDISVIIPAHNASDYIERAIKSVITQTDMSWEIIIVENGSTDDTYIKSMKYAEKYSNINVFQSEKGVSKARNYGLKKATGKWICFLDADDYIYPDAFNEIYKYIKDESDLILFGHNSETHMVKGKCVKFDGKEEYHNLRCEMIKNPTQNMTVWGKLFKNQIIEKNRIEFDEQLELAEDSDFTFRYMQNASKALRITSQLYHYSKDNVSTVRTYKAGSEEKYIKSLNHTKEYTIKDTKEIQEAYNQYIIANLLIILVHDIYCHENPESSKQRRNHLKKLVRENVFSEAIKNMKFSDCRNIRMMPALCLKLKMYLMTIIMVKIRVYQNTK